MIPPNPSYTYNFVTPSAPRRRFSTSRRELLEIGIAYVVLTIDLAIILPQASFLFSGSANLVPSVIGALTTPLFVAVAALAALSGFIAHELAHKFVAQSHGFWAEFRMYPTGLLLSFVTALVGFLWAAPGATVVSGMDPRDRANWGRTSLAGPMANVAFGTAFYLGAIGLYLVGSGLFSALLLLAYINGWFGTFNLIPLGPLDGRKVLRWDRRAWVGSIVVCGTLAVAGLWAYSISTPLFVR